MTDDGGLRKRRRPDPSLPRDTVRDTSISFRALGLLLWIMDKPDGWSIRADHMAKDGKRADGTGTNGRPHRREGREAIRTALLDELAAEGYYRLERRRMLDGSIKMGTAASEDRVDSWAGQYQIFGRSPVPMSQQKDGTFLVLYPDGSLGPDDCDPPESVETDPGSNGDDSEETPGQTGDQKPVSGPPVSRNPAPVEPAPVDPESGNPGSGNPSPLGSKKERGFKKEENPPTPQPAPAAQAVVDAATGGGDSQFDDETRTLLAGALARALELKSSWKEPKVRFAMLQAISAGRKPEDVAVAIVLAAQDPQTAVPGRILNEAWWSMTVESREAPFVAVPPLTPDDRCTRRNHEAELRHNCRWCRGEQLAVKDEPSPPPTGSGQPTGDDRPAGRTVGRATVPAQDGRKRIDVPVRV